MQIAVLDQNIKNIFLRHVEKSFHNKTSSTIAYDINNDINNDPVVKSIINLAVWQFMNAGLFVHQEEGEIIYEKNSKNSKDNDIKKIQCDNDLYYFQKYHTCMFILQTDENNFLNIYPKYESERIRFPLLPFLCGIELNETVEQILAKESIYIFKGDLHYQDLSKKDNLVRIIVRMKSV